MPAHGTTPRLLKEYCCFPLEIRPSGIHRWGVFTKAPIPKRRKVIEYTGQKLNRKQAKERAGRRHIYLFSLDNYWCIDGAVCGSGAEFVNHSCEPNLRATIMKGHILFMSIRPIAKGEELFIDYHIGNNVAKIPCRCGAPTCRGSLNIPK